MQSGEGLTERQFRILEAVIQIYVETAQPAGSQSAARRSRLGISPASLSLFALTMTMNRMSFSIFWPLPGLPL